MLHNRGKAAFRLWRFYRLAKDMPKKYFSMSFGRYLEHFPEFPLLWPYFPAIPKHGIGFPHRKSIEAQLLFLWNIPWLNLDPIVINRGSLLFQWYVKLFSLFFISSKRPLARQSRGLGTVINKSYSFWCFRKRDEFPKRAWKIFAPSPWEGNPHPMIP